MTKQASFEETYHHIEAPTVSDEDYGREFKKRKLTIPTQFTGPEAWRSEELYYLRNDDWTFKRKLDGENIRIKWDGNEVAWNGKTDKFVCNSEFTDYMNSTFLEEIFEEKFGREKTVLLFLERMGNKVQTNELKLDNVEAILYDVKIGDTWLEEESIKEIANYFGIHTCYDFMPDPNHHGRLIEIIEECSEGRFKDWEGVVAQPRVGLKDRRGKRLIVKIKNKDYLR